VQQLLKNINCTGTTERPKGSGRPRSFRTSEFRKTLNLWRSSSAVMKVLCTLQNTYDIEMEMNGHFTVLFSALCMIFG